MTKIRVCNTPDYHWVFNTETGFFARWGKTQQDDPVYSPMGPEIADIEISTICNGIGKSMEKRKPCSWCYKSNTGCGKNMTLEFFKEHVFAKLPKNITQIAFGIGDLDGNPDLYAIMQHCRDNGVIPNITTNGMGLTDEHAEKLVKVCGAIAVSHYHLPDVCFNAVAKLCWFKAHTEGATLRQVNIHKLLSDETFDECLDLINMKGENSAVPEDRLTDLNAIVFLLLKPKGDRNKLHGITDPKKYEKLVGLAREMDVQIGMDSCSAPLMLKTAEVLKMEEVVPSVEPCESTLFSIYINTDGEVFPCSFTEGTQGWETGIQMSEVKDFTQDVWMNERVTDFRSKLLGSANGCNGCKMQKHCRACPVYDITPCKE